MMLITLFTLLAIIYFMTRPSAEVKALQKRGFSKKEAKQIENDAIDAAINELKARHRSKNCNRLT